VFSQQAWQKQVLWTTRARRVTPFDAGDVCTSADYIEYTQGMLAWAVREENKTVRTIVQTLSKLARLLFRPTIILNSKAEVTTQVDDIMQTLTDILPVAEHSILLHVCNHIVQQQYNWGVISMFIFERVNNLIKNLITNRQHPEGSLAHNYDRTVHHLPTNIAQSSLHATSVAGNLYFLCTKDAFYMNMH